MIEAQILQDLERAHPRAHFHPANFRLLLHLPLACHHLATCADCRALARALHATVGHWLDEMPCP